MNASVHRVTKIYTTPGQLRRAADALERAWRNCHLGDDVPKIVEYGENGSEIHLVADQEEIRDEEREEQNKK